MLLGNNWQRTIGSYCLAIFSAHKYFQHQQYIEAAEQQPTDEVQNHLATATTETASTTTLHCEIAESNTEYLTKTASDGKEILDFCLKSFRKEYPMFVYFSWV